MLSPLCIILITVSIWAPTGHSWGNEANSDFRKPFMLGLGSRELGAVTGAEQSTAEPACLSSTWWHPNTWLRLLFLLTGSLFFLCVEIKWKFETQRISGTEGQTLLFSSKSSSAAPRNGVTMLWRGCWHRAEQLCTHLGNISSLGALFCSCRTPQMRCLPNYPPANAILKQRRTKKNVLLI